MAENFNLAREEVMHFAGTLSDEVNLQIYGLGKQATVGDIMTAKPAIFDQKERAKWEAWNSNKGKSQEQARAEYVQVVKANAPPEIAKKL